MNFCGNKWFFSPIFQQQPLSSHSIHGYAESWDTQKEAVPPAAHTRAVSDSAPPLLSRWSWVTCPVQPWARSEGSAALPRATLALGGCFTPTTKASLTFRRPPKPKPQLVSSLLVAHKVKACNS